MGQLTYTTQEVQDRLDAVGTLVRPNLLDNAYFVGGGSQQGGGQFPINQRGQTSYSDSGYMIDRWANINNTNVQITQSGLTITASGDIAIYRQILEIAYLMAGEAVTISVLSSNGALYSATGTVPSTIPSSDYEVAVAAFPVGNMSFHVGPTCSVQFYLPTAGNEITVKAAKLELGSTQTLAHQENGEWVLNEIPNYQQELAKCQRYFIGFNDSDNHWCASGTGLTSTDVLVVFPTPVTMRAVPSVTFRDAYLQGSSSVWLAVTGMSAKSKNENSVALMCATTGLTAGAAVTLAATKIFLSADL